MLSTQRIQLENKKEKNNYLSKEYKVFTFFNMKIIIIIGFTSLLLFSLFIFLSLNFKESENEIRNISNIYINSKVKSLSQFLMTYSQKYSTVTNGTYSNITNFNFIKSKYDIYTLNESLLLRRNNSYTKKYSTVIIINNQCIISDENNNENCELYNYLDLTVKTKNNLKNNENIEEIKKAILPICIIEHTSTNDILSVTCPETLSENLKNDIISAFQKIKPSLSNNKSDLIINHKNENIYINIFNKSKENKTNDYEIITNIVTDKNLNLEKNNKISKYKIIKDDKNRNEYIFEYSLENINNEDKNSKEINFIKNLYMILELIRPLMKKEEYNSMNISKNLIKNEIISKRKLDNGNVNLLGEKEESFFTKIINGININISLKNDFGLGQGEKTKIFSNFKRGNKTDTLFHDEIYTNINKTLNNFISLTKAGNILAYSLYQKLNESLSNLQDVINYNMSTLNNILVFKDLSSIFDSTLTINNLTELPYSFISSSNNLYTNISLLNNNTTENSLLTIKNSLKNNIESFHNNSHYLLDNIINNLIQLSDVLSSNKSKITDISTYYLQYEDTSYETIINKIKNIIDNYNIKEDNLIRPILNNIIKEFSINFNESIRLVQSLLDNIIIKLENKSLSINLGNNEDIKIVINNLNKTKININQIISKIYEELTKITYYNKENEYLESHKELDDNKNVYKEIIENSTKIAYNLDNNLLIDKTFDNIMSEYKNNFIYILNYIRKSKLENFPLSNNIFTNTTFIQNLFDKMEEDFKNEKIKIISYIKNENKENIDLINNKIIHFTQNNKETLDEIIKNIDIYLSESILDNINIEYNTMLNTTFDSINNVINNNILIAQEYFINVNNSMPSNCTQLFKNKAEILLNSLTQVKNYIQLNLKNDLENKYNTIIQNIRNNLNNFKSIKNNSKYLLFLLNHTRIIDSLTSRFDYYFSIDLFNKNYLPLINEYINNKNNYLNIILNDLNILYNSILTLPYSSNINYDYYRLRTICKYDCGFSKIYVCLRKKCTDYYDGYNVNNTNNYLNIKNITFNEYSNIFDTLFNQNYLLFSQSILSYINTIKTFENNLTLINNELLDKNIK